MSAAGNIYESARLAHGYAYHRPPVHQAVLAKLREHLRPRNHFQRALDVGCGAGLSTAALETFVASAYGIEPIPAMLKHRKAVAEGANFVVAKAEHLPFADDAFDLMTAAGSLNYADMSHFLPEASRVLKDDGLLVIYDFSAGRRLLNDERLLQWFETFQQRYPPQPGYALDVQALPYQDQGMRLESFKPIEVAVPMTYENYVQYALSETSVELAIWKGVAEEEIKYWCETTLAPIFADAVRDVYFDAYFACVSRQPANKEAI